METQVKISTCPVAFSPSAIQEIKRLRSELEDAQQYLRVGAKGGGCSGLTYVLEFDKMKEGDHLYELEGVSIIIDIAHLIYIKDVSIDWSGGLNARGFTFTNPNASSSCGCGTSFAV